jgi:hypothetical protein
MCKHKSIYLKIQILWDLVMFITCSNETLSSRSKQLVLTMHGFSNAGYFLTLGFLSLIGSMSFWFRDVISEGRAKSLLLKVVQSNYTLNLAKAIPKEEIKLVLDSYSKEINSFNFSKDQLGYYLAGLLEGNESIFLPAIGNTTLNRVLNPRIVFTSHINNIGLSPWLLLVWAIAIYTARDYIVYAFTFSDLGTLSLFSVITTAYQCVNGSLEKTKETSLTASRWDDAKVPLDPNYVTGFADGEWCFYIRINKSAAFKTGYVVQLRFMKSQHSRDHQLFNSFINFFNCGGVIKVLAKKSVVEFRVYSFKNILNKIIPFLINTNFKGLKDWIMHISVGLWI